MNYYIYVLVKFIAYLFNALPSLSVISAFQSTAKKTKKGGSGGGNNGNEPFKGMWGYVPLIIGGTLATATFLAMTGSEKM